MAEQKAGEALDTADRLYIKLALERLEDSLRRSLQKEVPGSEISRLRNSEITRVSDLARRFA